MSSAPAARSANHLCEILGVTPSANADEIANGFLKKLRQLRIDRQALELRRLQAAYTILQDDESKAEYLALGTLSQSVSQSDLRASLDTAIDAFWKADWLRAILNFQQALELGEKRAVVRHLLGLSLLYNDQGLDGIRHIEAACVAQPRHPGFALQRAEAVLALGSPKDALALFEYARPLDSEQPLVWLGIARCHAALKDADAALKALDGLTLTASPRLDELELSLLLRRVSIHVMQKNKESVVAVLEQLKKGLSSDEDKQQYALDRLADIVEKSVERVEDLDEGEGSFAGWLVMRVQALPWVRAVEPNTMAHSRFCALHELPDPLRTRLTELPTDPPVCYASRTLPAGWHFMVAMFPAVLFLPFFYMMRGGEMSSEIVPFQWMMLLELFAVFALVMRGVKIMRARVANYHALHSFFLVRVHIDEVLLMPLNWLRRAYSTDYYVNGRYRNSIVTAQFQDQTVSWNVVSPSEARVFTEGLMWGRQRANIRRRLGLLSKEEGYSSVAQAPERSTQTARALSWLRLYATAALVAIVCMTGLKQYAANRVEERRWDRASDGGLRALREYLRESPRAPHAKEARDRIHAVYADTLATYKRVAGKHASQEVQAQVERLITAAEKATSPRVRVEFIPQFDLTRPAPAESTKNTRLFLPQEQELNTARKAPEAAITAFLSRMFNQISTERVIEFRDALDDADEFSDGDSRSKKPREEPFAKVEVRYSVRLTEPLLTLPDELTADDIDHPTLNTFGLRTEFQMSITLTGEQALLYKFDASARGEPQPDLPPAIEELLRARRLHANLSPQARLGDRWAFGALGATIERFIRLCGADLGFLRQEPAEDATEPSEAERPGKRRH